MKDPIVDEVRATRAEIAEQCGYDLKKIMAHAADTARRIPGLTYVTPEQIKAHRSRRSDTKSPRE
jgi:hypothetical protein